ncbi:hypothetical protein JNB62_07350 [Microbacterium jejuense]|uniref:Uncharacterized protein n=1 Tax=Microbacterium jejuense TaxID=1263637 RepID=A0ABS7HMM8_9MICO|nr:hypothetical protein [Microbacterium jejuense]MBW9093492.1 hypothetical protein [Microbacterium jejuense]
MDEQKSAPQEAPRSGWLWKFVALISGAPPIAVYGAEEEVEQERADRRAG